MSNVTVNTKWGVEELDKVWEMINWLMVYKNASRETQASIIEDLTHYMRIAVDKWNKLEKCPLCGQPCAP